MFNYNKLFFLYKKYLVIISIPLHEIRWCLLFHFFCLNIILKKLNIFIQIKNLKEKKFFKIKHKIIKLSKIGLFFSEPVCKIEEKIFFSLKLIYEGVGVSRMIYGENIFCKRYTAIKISTNISSRENRPILANFRSKGEKTSFFCS